MIASPMYLENVASEGSQLHKSGSSCKKSIPTSRLGASCLTTTQKAMPDRAGALSPANIQQGEARILPCSALSAFRIEAVPGGVESLAFDISTRQLTRMPARGRLTPAISLE